MPQFTAFSILAVTVGVSLGRPRFGTIRLHHSHAALLGAALCLVSGVVPPVMAAQALQILWRPVVTIVSLMIMTLIAERIGIFALLAQYIARAAGGDGRRLFRYLFVCGAITGGFFTNDAAVLIFTPLAFKLVEQADTGDWELSNKLPYYFAVLFVANLVGGLVISNPINVVVATLFQISFLEYAKWMILPAVVSVVASYYGLLWFFRSSIPSQCERVERLAQSASVNRAKMGIAAGVLFATIAGFFSESLTGIPTWTVALSGALALALVYSYRSPERMIPILRGVGWDVIVFVVGIFIVAYGLRNAGLTNYLGGLIKAVASGDMLHLSGITALISAFCSSLMNNHPTANIMAMVIQDFHHPIRETKFLALSALIGGDLGPKMLPIGSLAALLWFRMLRDRGVEAPYRLYIKIGIPVTLAAVILSVLTLNLEYYLSAW